LPPWRRGKPAEDEAIRAGTTSEARAAARAGGLRRELPWSTKREVEAAPAGSLTGGLGGLSRGGTLGTGLFGRKSGLGDAGAEDTLRLGPFDASIWKEQKYSRMLMLQAKHKIMRGKAYEVPEEMMTMTTGPRPKWKPEKKEKEGGDEVPLEESAEARLKQERAGSEEPEAAAVPPVEEAPAAAADEEKEEKPEKQKSPRKEKKEKSGVGGPFESLPGDSKDIMKLKKKLREIQKIEDAIVSGEAVEPNQMDKVTKKAGYVEELRTLESIARTPVD